MWPACPNAVWRFVRSAFAIITGSLVETQGCAVQYLVTDTVAHHLLELFACNAGTKAGWELTVLALDRVLTVTLIKAIGVTVELAIAVVIADPPRGHALGVVTARYLIRETLPRLNCAIALVEVVELAVQARIALIIAKPVGREAP